jgi:hypothetical protein
MEVKVVCNCGQKFKFDVEPVGGRMPVAVFCPVCGRDGTQAANDVLAKYFSNQPLAPVAMALQPAAASPPPPPLISAAAPAMCINRPEPASTTPAASRPITSVRSPAATASRAAEEQYSLVRGIVGAIIGAAVGAGLMYGFFLLTDFRFPLMGTGVGALTGLGARVLARGTDMSLGVIAGLVALLSTAGTLYLMFGEMAGMFVISMVVSVSFAYKIAG